MPVLPRVTVGRTFAVEFDSRLRGVFRRCSNATASKFGDKIARKGCTAENARARGCFESLTIFEGCVLCYDEPCSEYETDRAVNFADFISDFVGRI